ncbi:metallophosphoesterase [Modestobacter sp. NPDC049651]|uniref:metallophosphoesterase n=1 Tax=unclassified Modestobacter TaxID=2643866 RepID=UPI0033FECDD2
MARRHLPDGGDQLELPFERTRSDRVRQAARTTGRVTGRVVAVVLRWVLRLALPVLGAAGALQALPYRATVQGIPFEVRGTLFTRPWLSADTTLGSWQFPELTGLPVGVHVRPEDVDVLQLTKAAGGDLPGFVSRLRGDFSDLVPRIALWLVGELLLGALAGLAAAAALNMALRYWRGLPRRPHELRRRAVQLAAALGVLVLVAGVGAATYNPEWSRQSQLTGTLAAAQLFPDQLSDYYSQQSKAFDVLGSVVAIQAALQQQIEPSEAAGPALEVMFISDMHLAANYPLVQQYVASYGVDLVVNTGDEAEFGTPAELTPQYLDGLRALTAQTPMIWLAGNHDSPGVEDVLRGIPGVTVLGDKTATAGGYRVTASEVQAFGLTIAGLPDPRVYGGPGAYGADDPKVVDPLQRRAVRAALGAPDDDEDDDAAATPTPTDDATDGAAGAAAPLYDVFATHEPVAAEELREVLPGEIRQTNSGHTHKQNKTADIQADDGTIDLVEGSTGAGGLDNIVRGTARPPIEFSIESVGADCQFQRVVRFQIDSAPDAASQPATASAYGDDVTASTIYFRPQQVGTDRVCGPQLGIGPVLPVVPRQ